MGKPGPTITDRASCVSRPTDGVGCSPRKLGERALPSWNSTKEAIVHRVTSVNIHTSAAD